MITCREAEALIEARLDGETTAGSEPALHEHLAGCTACSEWLDREAAVDAALLAHFADAAPSPELARRVLRRIHAEESAERLAWVADALNAAAGLALVALAMWVLGRTDPATVKALLAVAGGAAAVGAYPLVLAHGGREESRVR